MLKHADPLQSELRTLEAQTETSRIKAEEIEKIIHELEESIAK